MRKVDGYLPTAEVAFIDEIFKANSAILNALLTLLNERLFDNGNQRLPVPLLCLVSPSRRCGRSCYGTLFMHCPWRRCCSCERRLPCCLLVCAALLLPAPAATGLEHLCTPSPSAHDHVQAALSAICHATPWPASGNLPCCCR